MFLRNLDVFLIFFVIVQIFATQIASELEFFVNSTTTRPSEFQDIKDRLSKLELESEIRSTLKELKENINQLKETKQEIVEEIEGKLEDRLKVYNEKLLNEIKNEFIEIRKAIQNQTLEKTEEAPSQKYKNFPKDCRAVQKMGNKASGIYRIKPEVAPEAFLVWCDMKVKEGGWTYVLNRFDGSQNFYLNWTDYKSGFGNLSGEFWLGLEHLYELTNSTSNELLFEMLDWDLKKAYARYSNFSITNESDGYSYQKGDYSGDAGDAFRSHRTLKFSTADRDQDTYLDGNCAALYHGGWWYSFCFSANPTGRYENQGPLLVRGQGIHWNLFRNDDYSLKEIRMMIRPTDI